ncbi:MAG: hypothetical protein R3E97_03220 [Candidatus Eisenbacteria bacterium]
MPAIWILHLAATLFMTGVIWFVQLVHYPLFTGVGASGFADYEREHSRRTSWVVVLPMLVELATGVYLAFTGSIGGPAGFLTLGEPQLRVLSWAAFGLLIAIWTSTFLLQVPAHGILARGFDRSAHRRLVTTNWIRTVLWSARSVLLLWLLLRAS